MSGIPFIFKRIHQIQTMYSDGVPIRGVEKDTIKAETPINNFQRELEKGIRDAKRASTGSDARDVRMSPPDFARNTPKNLSREELKRNSMQAPPNPPPLAPTLPMTALEFSVPQTTNPIPSEIPLLPDITQSLSQSVSTKLSSFAPSGWGSVVDAYRKGFRPAQKTPTRRAEGPIIGFHRNGEKS